MSFKLSDFIAAPSQELLDKAKKSDLLDIADHYGLSNIKTSMLKHEIKNILIQFFVDQEIFDSSATSQILVTQTDLQWRELEITRQIEMEKLKFEYEERIRLETLERDERIRAEKAEREERIRLETLEREERMYKQRLEMEEREKEKQRALEYELEDHWSCSSPERLSHCKLMRFKLIENQPMKVYAWTLLTPGAWPNLTQGHDCHNI